MRRFFLLVAAVGLLAGCHRAGPRSTQSTHPSTPVASGVADFSFDLYRQIASGDRGNILFSPFSISSAVSMAYMGSRSETALQMAHVMKYPSSFEIVANGFNWIYHYLKTQEESPVQLYPANGFWLQKGLDLQASFAKVMESRYQGQFHQVDFTSDPKAARGEVNGWVSEQTHGKIEELVSEGGVNEATRLLLVSSLYFQAPWKFPFSANSNQMANFTPLTGSPVQVPMMRQSVVLPYYKGTGFSFVKIPYASADSGPRLSLLLMMPDNAKHLPLVEKRISPKALRYGLARLQMRQVDLWLPKFSLRGQIDLSSYLPAMGMVIPFSPRANFSGIDGGRDLMLQQVVHAAMLAVDEAGTEAAAATAVAVGLKAAAGPMGKSVRFHADHPFLFMLYDDQTGAVLLMGRVADPSR